MVFTVVNYLPLIEEEVSHSKKETGKKSASDTEGAGEPEDECGQGHESMIDEGNNLYWLVNNCESAYINSFDHYDYLRESTCSPPPEA